MIWVGPTRALSEPRIKALRLDCACQGPPTFAVQKNCIGLNPAYQSAEARLCATRLQKS